MNYLYASINLLRVIIKIFEWNLKAYRLLTTNECSDIERKELLEIGISQNESGVSLLNNLVGELLTQDTKNETIN
jgi:hypothetical protein